MLVLGFMTGTSLDAVDMAVLDTDGETILAFGPAGERKLTDATRDVVLEATRQALAWERGTPEPAIFRHAAEMVAEEHHAAAETFLQANGLAWPDLDLVAPAVAYPARHGAMLLPWKAALAALSSASAPG